MKNKTKGMPSYIPSKEETEAYIYCVRNNIRISPRGITRDPNHWHIEVCVSEGKWYRDASKYSREEIWGRYYEYCLYYYNKRQL